MTERAWPLLPAGFAIAAVGAVCGIGGGLFAVPLLHYVFKMPLRAAVATSLALVFTTATTSTVSELLHREGVVLWNVILPLIGGALVGAQFGYLASRRIPERALKKVFAAVLVLVGLRLLLVGAPTEHPGELAEALGALGIAKVLAIGLFAGTVAPLLGIGGGLIVVPALLLVLPEIGNLGARSASLGMAVVTAARSLHLYLGEGAVDLRRAAWFASGALGGALTGVQLVHVDGVAAAGQTVLAGILLVTAMRFARDLRRQPVAA